MPRFFFDLFDGGTQEDRDGEVCESVAAARVHATKVAGDFRKNCPRDKTKGWAICVRDESGKQIMRVALSGQPP